MEAEGQTAALLVAAGSGSRAGAGLPKAYREIAGRPLLAHALAALDHPRIDRVQVVISADHEEIYQGVVAKGSLPDPVVGGASRQQSVRNGLAALARSGGIDRVLIHDVARPFVPKGVIDRLIEALGSHSGAVPVIPVVDTLARDGASLGDTIPRDGLVRVQTPQAFRLAAIIDAHASWHGPEASDDAQVARAAGIEVATVAGDPTLEKLTYEADFARADAYRADRLISRSGFGFDVHAFAPGDTLVLGGIAIPHDRGLAGHSDADVLLHAITDALLGAIGAGDIGDHFPPSNPRWKGADSSRFVEHARSLVEGAGGRIDHVDATLICEQPRIGPFKDRIRHRIADLLMLPPGRISIKATTTERLGFTGRGEGIAAQALVNVRIPEDR